MLCVPTTLVHHLSLVLFLDKSQVNVKWIKKKKKTIPLKMVRSKDWAENVSKVKL